VFIEVLEIFLF